MEENIITNDNQSNETESQSKGKQKNYHLTFEEYINRMKIAFANAKLSEINAQLSVMGYTEERLNELLKKVGELELLHQKQKKEYAEQYEQSDKAEEKRKTIDEKYKTHLALARVLFKKDVKALAALELNGKRKTAYSGWYQQVSNFYAQLLQTPEFLAKAKTINLKEADFQAVKTQLSEMVSLKEGQKKEAAQAQKATEMRDQAFDELYQEYADLIAYAKAVLTNEQNLEALGIVVKR